MSTPGAVVPPDCLLVEQHYDRRDGVYFYDIITAGQVISQRQLTEGRLLNPDDSTAVIVTRGRMQLRRTITNHQGRPQFFTRRGRRDWREQFRWWW